MDIISELKNSKKVILLEPNYKRKYIPLGLAKIATMVKDNGGEVIYQRVYTPLREDAVCITSLFTYDSVKIIDAVNRIRYLSPSVPIILGGVYATLMPNHLQKHCPEVKIFEGYSKELDSYPPDYSIDWGLDHKWNDYSFLFSSRGCPNKCSYCAVWKIEPELWINENWREHVHPDKPYIMISDNNLSAQPTQHLEEICAFIRDNNKKVVFDNGFDCKYITSDFAQLLSSVKYIRNGFRLAFDRIEEDGQFQRAVEIAQKAGIPKHSMMAYVLFNFQDNPQEANYRMSECLRLGIHPYPQQYTPLHKTDRKSTHIGKHWTKNLLRCFRYFWIMPGIHSKMTFEEFVSKDASYQLIDEDWSCFYAKKVTK